MTTRTTEQQRKSYDFLLQAEQDAREFSLEELAAFTGWTLSTVHTYLRKKWQEYFEKNSNGTYSVSGVKDMGEDNYLNMMSQVNSTILKSREF